MPAMTTSGTCVPLRKKKHTDTFDHYWRGKGHTVYILTKSEAITLGLKKVNVEKSVKFADRHESIIISRLEKCDILCGTKFPHHKTDICDTVYHIHR